MILHLNYDTTRVALAISHWPTGRQQSDWKHLYLVVTPGEEDAKCSCHTGGSPWYLWGCWPGKPTGVDVANPGRPDFEPFYISAHELDSKGRIVFILPERWRQIARGRYTGAVWYAEPYGPLPKLPNVPKLYKLIEKYKTPTLYSYSDCNSPCPPPLPPLSEPPQACILTKFDIDYGYKCSEHIIQEAAVEMSLAACEEDI